MWWSEKREQAQQEEATTNHFVRIDVSGGEICSWRRSILYVAYAYGIIFLFLAVRFCVQSLWREKREEWIKKFIPRGSTWFILGSVPEDHLD